MRRLALAAALLAFATPAFAGQPVALKADASDGDGLVTLGDIFEGAGAAAKVPVASRGGASLILDAAVVQGVARRAGLDWANAEGLRKIVVRGSSTQGPAAVASRGNVEVLTYARSLTAGEVVQPADVVWGKAAAAPADTPSDADQVIGLAAKRPLRAGAAVSLRDVAAAQVIKAGEVITVTYQDGGISLSMQGKAMGAAGEGEFVNVQNLQSRKILQALVIGPGQAIVGPAADQLKAARSTRIASR
ncbi:flagellar basal body P-ring formation chaperone FlgA [Phenylobacterium sp.]|jgi:flagella basal body P-ring formation protein FlgA|uniref:flagellar basal body P-ring formation chaperone FlgA n=1 Tax=Phenylobacterium sp. TaxID=1871053 RepID=UPI002F938FFB